MHRVNTDPLEHKWFHTQIYTHVLPHQHCTEICGAELTYTDPGVFLCWRRKFGQQPETKARWRRKRITAVPPLPLTLQAEAKALVVLCPRLFSPSSQHFLSTSDLNERQRGRKMWGRTISIPWPPESSGVDTLSSETLNTWKLARCFGGVTVSLQQQPANLTHMKSCQETHNSAGFVFLLKWWIFVI